MGGNVYSNGKRWGSVAGQGKVDATDPVFLKPKADPGVSDYSSDSSAIKLPAGTVKDKGTDVALEVSAYTNAKHSNSLTLMGLLSFAPKDSPTVFLANFAKRVLVEGNQLVVHGTQAMTTAIHTTVKQSTVIKNAVRVYNALTPDLAKKVAGDSGKELLASLDSAALLGVLKDVALGAGGVLLTATGVGAAPGAIATARSAVSAGQRVAATAQQAQEMAKQAQELIGMMSDPNMDPTEAATKVIKFFTSGVGQLLVTFITKKAIAVSKSNIPSTVNTHVAGNAPAAPTTCACSIPRPVIIATGEKLLDHTDFELDGPLALNWRRYYRSGDPRAEGWFGQGWSHPLSCELWLQAQQLRYHDPQGRGINLPVLDIGQRRWIAYEQFEVHRIDERRWALHHKDGRSHLFEQLHPGQWRLTLTEMRDRTGQRVQLHYSADKAFNPWGRSPRPHAITDASGRQLSLHWTQHGQLSRVQLERGPSGCPALTEPLELARYDYAADPFAKSGEPLNLVAHTRLGQTQSRHYHYSRHLLVGYQLEDGARFEAQYEHPHDKLTPASRVVRSSCLADGQSHQLSYQGRYTWVRDALGRVSVYEHDARQDIVAVRDALGQITRTPFDANGHPKGSTDALGRSSSTVFDARGNLTQIIDASGAKTQLRYNALDLPVLLTDALGGQWQREYDERGQLIQSTDPLGQQSAYAYDERGHVVAITDALGKTKTLHWSAGHQLLRYTDCSGQTTAFGYDASGQLAASTDALGQTTGYRFDALGRLQAVRSPDGAEHHYRWDAQGRLLAYRDPLGQSTQWRYNASGDIRERTDALGQSLRYSYDQAGRLTQLRHEDGQSTHFRYDALDRLTDEVGLDGRHQRYVYNAASELTHRIERGGSEHGPGRITRYERDALGRLTAKRHEGGEVDGLGGEHKANNTSADAHFSYDKLGRLTQAANALATVQLAYDPVGQLVKESQLWRLGAGTGFEGNGENNAENNAANPTEHRFVLEHRYDALGNRIATRLPGQGQGQVQTLGQLYYGSGHLHQISLDGQVISDFERDALHRETSRTQGALQTQWGYDAAGRLSQQRVQRMPFSATGVTGFERPVVPWTADGANALAHIQQQLPQRHYQWDAGGQLTNILDNTRGQRHYAYDAIGRLTQAVLGGAAAGSTSATPAPSLQEQFAWDANSNPAALTQNGNGIGNTNGSANTASSSQSLSGNRLRVWQDCRYDYDAHGNLIRKTEGKRGSAKHRITLLHWDAEHQLVQAQVLQGQAAVNAEEREAAGQALSEQDLRQAQTTDYAYDALGRRIAKRTRQAWQHDATQSDQTTLFAWDGDRLLVEQTGQNSTLTIYEPQGFVPIAQVHNGQVQHLHTDHLGMPQEASNAEGQMTWRVSYKAWGSALKEEWEQVPEQSVRGLHGGGGSSGGTGSGSGEQSTSLTKRAAANESQFALYRCKLRFQGQYFDEETGLHYNRFRYYEPESGRFINQDPIGLLGGVNLFAYAPNPVGWADPWGLAGNPATATHITYQGIKDGKPYIGYASMQGCRDPEDVLNYRYGGNFGVFDGGQEPAILYSGYGQAGKDLTRGMEQAEFEKSGGLAGTSNKQNPVGKNNKRKDIYKAATKSHCPCGSPKKPDDC